jgi:hypothetical protein
LCLENAQGGSCRQGSQVLKAGIAEQLAEFTLGPLAPAGRHHEHLQIRHEGLGGAVAICEFRHPSFNDQELGVARHAASAAAQNVGGTRVIPIVDDVLEKIDIPITGYIFKKAAAFDSAPIGNTTCGEHIGCMIGDVGKIEEDAAKIRMSRQNRTEHFGCAATYVDDETSFT